MFNPPAVGDTPLKLVFQPRGDLQDARRQFRELQGQISAFQLKCRQNHQISGQATVSMQQALPGGGQLRYLYNTGQETIYVVLIGRGPVTPPLPVRLPGRDPREPVLAIDVLHVPKLFQGANVHWYTETTQYYPATPPTVIPDRQSMFTFLPGGIVQEGPFSPQFFIDAYGSDGRYVRIEGGPFTVIISPEASFYLDFDSFDYGRVITRWLSEDKPGALVVTLHTFRFPAEGEEGGYFGYPSRIAYKAVSVIQRGETIPGQPAYTTTTRQDEEDLRDFFDVLVVAGARVEGKVPYEAKWTGEPDDGRLIPAERLKQGAGIERHLTGIDDGDRTLLVGAGFVALPTEPLQGGISPSKTTVDIYVESADNTQRNSRSTSLKTSRFKVDDSSMVYDPHGRFDGRIQVREFVDVNPMAVKVTVTSDQHTRRPVGEVGYEDVFAPSDPDRTVEWFFAAAPGWSDGGNGPADPDRNDARGKPIMGTLLATEEFSFNALPGLDPMPRRFISEPEWPGGVQTMIKIASVEWTPADQPHTKGTAKILMDGPP